MPVEELVPNPIVSQVALFLGIVVVAFMVISILLTAIHYHNTTPEHKYPEVSDDMPYVIEPTHKWFDDLDLSDCDDREEYQKNSGYFKG